MLFDTNLGRKSKKAINRIPMNSVFLLPATEIIFDIVASHSCTATKNQLVHFVLLVAFAVHWRPSGVVYFLFTFKNIGINHSHRQDFSR